MPTIRLQGQAERLEGIYYEVNTDAPALGAGGMGQVYRGVRIDHNGQRRPVAIKFLFDDLPPSAIERSRREANIRIQSENLVEMFGFIEVPDPATGVTHYHVVSELLEGVMLYDLLEGNTGDRNGEPFPFATQLYNEYLNNRETFALRVTKAVLSGVMAMHDRGYIHRDIDPSNIMVTKDGRIKLIDYGIAKNLNSDNTREMSLTSTGQFMGKAAYAAPELITGDVAHQNETTDIYAIGIMLFQLLTGHLPFDGANHEVLEMHMHKNLPLDQISNPELRKVVNHATRKKQGERFISASEFRVDVERAERGQTTSSGEYVDVPKKKKSGCLGKGLIIGLIGGILLITGVVIGIVALIAWAGSVDDTETTTETVEVALSPEEAEAASDLDGAMAKLRNKSTVLEAIGDLEKLVDYGGSIGSEAAVILSRIYNHSLTGAQGPIVNAEVEEDYALSYRYADIALRLDETNPHAVFLMAEKYYGGPGETGGELNRDMEQAITLYVAAYMLAKEQGDAVTESNAMKRLQQFEIDPDQYIAAMNAVDEAVDVPAEEEVVAEYFE